MRKHFIQILIGLFVTIVGGISVYYVTASEKSPQKEPLTSDGLSVLNFHVDGQLNDIYLSQGRTKMSIVDIFVNGSQKDLSYNIPPNYKVYLNVDGQQNTVHIDYRLRDFVFVNDQGTMSRVYFTDQ